jgi:hypothetical protein
MHYKTIVLELLQEQYPRLHERLRASRTLLSALDEQASALRRHHQRRMEALERRHPDRDPALRTSQALELALSDLRDDLPSESAAADETSQLDAAMAFLRRHTPPA